MDADGKLRDSHYCSVHLQLQQHVRKTEDRKMCWLALLLSPAVWLVNFVIAINDRTFTTTVRKA